MLRIGSYRPVVGHARAARLLIQKSCHEEYAPKKPGCASDTLQGAAEAGVVRGVFFSKAPGVDPMRFVATPALLARKLKGINQALAVVRCQSEGVPVERIFAKMEAFYGQVLICSLGHIVPMERDSEKASARKSSEPIESSQGFRMSDWMAVFLGEIDPDANDSFSVLREATKWKEELPNAFCNLTCRSVDSALEHNIKVRQTALSGRGEPDPKHVLQILELLEFSRIWGRERSIAEALGLGEVGEGSLSTRVLLPLRRRKLVPGGSDLGEYCRDIVQGSGAGLTPAKAC